MNTSPEIGNLVNAGGINTNYHDEGEGHPLVLLHGSGPGVTAWANWRLVIPNMAQHFRVVATDIIGFGYTERPADIKYEMKTWLTHAIDILDALKIEKTHLVGNSFGGSLAIALAIYASECNVYNFRLDFHKYILSNS